MTVMRLRVAVISSFCVVLWQWCNGKNIPDNFQKGNIIPTNMFGKKNPTSKTIGQLIMEAMEDLQGNLDLKKKNDGILMELDMLLSKQQYYSLYQQPNRTKIRSKRKAGRHHISKRWPNGVIPYRFREGDFDQGDQDMVRQAMREWELETCIRFREATFSDINYVVFFDGEGCYSKLGMMEGPQGISLNSVGCRDKRAYLHEIGHAIGLVHEHNRPDRDDYVKIIWENVRADMSDQFTKYTSQDVDQMNVPYDYSSIMHYGAYDFSKVEGLTTIRVEDPEIEAIIGNVKELSVRDIEIVNKMYSCHKNCADKYYEFQCQRWARVGECDRNPAWMVPRCQKSCGKCYLSD